MATNSHSIQVRLPAWRVRVAMSVCSVAGCFGQPEWLVDALAAWVVRGATLDNKLK